MAISPDRVLLAAELPLESLCKQQDTFLLPDLLNSNGPITDELADVDIIRPKGKQVSATESLLHLQRNPAVREIKATIVCEMYFVNILFTNELHCGRTNIMDKEIQIVN